MRRSIFNLLLLLLFLPRGLSAQVAEPPIDRREHRGREGWERVIPTHLKAQYAGSMGLISAGFGWDYGRKCRWETDLMLGYLPCFEGEQGYVTFTLKQNYIPWSLSADGRLSFEPLYAGLYLNTIFGDEFWQRNPDRYPRGYYWFSTRMRIHIFGGTRITWHTRPDSFIRSVSLFFEVNTSDLYLVRKVGNSYLKASDVIGFSVGLRCQIF